MRSKKEFSKGGIVEVSSAHANLNIFSAVIALMESGCVYGDNNTARRIVALAKAETQRQLKRMDKGIERLTGIIDSP